MSTFQNAMISSFPYASRSREHDHVDNFLYSRRCMAWVVNVDDAYEAKHINWWNFTPICKKIPNSVSRFICCDLWVNVSYLGCSSQIEHMFSKWTPLMANAFFVNILYFIDLHKKIFTFIGIQMFQVKLIYGSTYDLDSNNFLMELSVIPLSWSTIQRSKTVYHHLYWAA